MTDFKKQVKDQLEADASAGEAKGANEAPDTPSNETVPGGRYLLNGKLVDANGEPIKDGK